MKTLRRLPWFAVALGAAACSSPSNSASPSVKPVRLAPKHAVIAKNAVTPLQGSMHPFARPERELGRMGPLVPLTNMSLLLTRSPAQEKRLARDMMDIQDPTSPRYHAWISPTEFGARYGASPADVARASAWLKAQGFEIIGASPSMSRLSFNGTSGQVEKAFQTELHRYGLAGKEHFAPSRVPMIPADLGTVITALHGVNDFRPPPPHPPAGPGRRRG